MPITTTPSIKYYELDSNPNLTGDGGQIPVFCGVSSNTGDPNKILRFSSYDEAEKSVELGGINNDSGAQNLLLDTLKEFFVETSQQDGGDIGVTYVYVVDMGSEPTNDDWLTAIQNVKSKHDIEVEAYVGTSDISIMESAYASILEDSEQGNPRIAYFTKYNGEDGTYTAAPDSELIELTSAAEGNTIKRSRICIIEPSFFGKILGRICVTPYYIEPGFLEFRTIEPGEFTERTPGAELALQNAGIIFGRDEKTRKYTYPKICLGVSTAFAELPDKRPSDMLLHSRRNTDNLIRAIYDVCYEQLKANETVTNLQYLQTDIDKIVNTEIESGYMMVSEENSPGTEVQVMESDSNPYELKVDGVAKPVNSTISIGFGMYVTLPNTTIEDQL